MSTSAARRTTRYALNGNNTSRANTSTSSLVIKDAGHANIVLKFAGEVADALENATRCGHSIITMRPLALSDISTFAHSWEVFDLVDGMTPHISGTSLSAPTRYAEGTREIVKCRGSILQPVAREPFRRVSDIRLAQNERRIKR
jgi:hypothetical protein